MKLRKGDTVQVITGKDKGKQGTVLQVLPGQARRRRTVRQRRVIVSGVNTAPKST